MKQKFRIILALLFIALIAVLSKNIYFKIQAKSVLQKTISDLPDFTLTTALDNEPFRSTIFKNSNDTILINFFSPTCEHCQYMASSFIKNKEQLQNVKIVMVTIDDSISVAKFKKDYQLNIMPNVLLLRDTKFQFEKIFGTSVVPSFFLYVNGKLKKRIIGETKIENLLG
ncbi:MAG TPA: TlpA disulfide reductase family protein [Segetibacter sp.]|jgi:thiol-disulfide isomerase/thioredoxin